MTLLPPEGAESEPALTPVELPPYEQWINDAAALLAAFVAMVRGDGPLLCSGRDHLKSLRMVQACILSSETGQAIRIADLDGERRRDGTPGKARPSASQGTSA